MIRVLVIDDEADMLNSVEKLLNASGMDVASAGSGKKALALFEENNFDVILCDLLMPEMDGMQLIRRFRTSEPETPIIIFSAFGTIDRAVEAMKLGAFNFIEKPFNSEHLILLIKRAYEKKKLSEENIALLNRSEEEFDFQHIISRSPKMKNVINMIKKSAPTEANVLITGESGTGKELAARAIHNLSKRASEAFVPVNCGALPENLFEAELFGYEKGAFTGAYKRKIGLMEYADKGSFFLDEVFETPVAIQVKMLRVLQDKKFRRLGGKELLDADVRFISATNKRLDSELENGNLREDFYYRLNVINIQLPPLRERKEDILLLANHFLKQASKTANKELSGFDDETVEIFIKYRWPGNVRELQNVVRRATAICDSDKIKSMHLPEKLRKFGELSDFNSLSFSEAKRIAVDKVERDYLLFLLKKYAGNVTKMAENSGFTRRHLHRILNKHRLNPNHWR